MSKSQKDYFLRQQMDEIKKEIGETGEKKSEADAYTIRIQESKMPDEARKEPSRELERMQNMSPQSAEYPVVKTYIDWLIDFHFFLLSIPRQPFNVAFELGNFDA